MTFLLRFGRKVFWVEIIRSFPGLGITMQAIGRNIDVNALGKPYPFDDYLFVAGSDEIESRGAQAKHFGNYFVQVLNMVCQVIQR